MSRAFVLGCLLCLVPRLSSLGIADESPQSLLNTTASPDDLSLVDPELSQTPLPKLVLPPAEPPAHVQFLPELVVKADEWRGVQCGVVDPRYAVFRHADKWASFWEKALAPLSNRLAIVPKIDFNKDMVIGVFMGEMPYPYYEIEIRSMKVENRPDQTQALVVRYREIQKDERCFYAPVSCGAIPFEENPGLPRPNHFFEGKTLIYRAIICW